MSVRRVNGRQIQRVNPPVVDGLQLFGELSIFHLRIRTAGNNRIQLSEETVELFDLLKGRING